jgi:hypothetical protein
MIQTFDRDGIRFQYPANWTLEDSEEPSEEAWMISVQSPETAFFLAALRPDGIDPADLADQTLVSLKADYQELDAEDRVETIAGLVAIGHDIDFLTVDTPITCSTRCLETPVGPLLLMWQVSEYDRPRNEPVLKAIVASLKIEDE